MSTIEQVIPRATSDEEVGGGSRERVCEDTAFRCMIALVWAHLGVWSFGRAGRTVSESHNGGMAYRTAERAWGDRVRAMPWWGLVPTSRRLISPTQAAWVAVALLIANAALYFLDLPFVPMHGLLAHHVPRIVVHVVAPHHAALQYLGRH